MLMRLYELTQNYNNLMELVENDIVTLEEIKDSINQVEGDIKEKCINVCKVLKNNEMLINGIKEEEKRLSNRRKALENNNQRLKELLIECLNSMPNRKIKSEIFNIGLQKNPPSVKIVDEEKIPNDYIITKEVSSIDKKKIIELLKSGEQIEGVELHQGESVRIR